MKAPVVLYFTFILIIFLTFSVSSQTIRVDSAYGENGIISIPGIQDGFNSFPLLQDDGTLIISGGLVSDSGYTQRFYKFKDSGELDSSFGVGGIMENYGLFHDYYMFFIKSQSDGRLIVGGASNIDEKANIFRLNHDGSIDNSFGNMGVFEVPIVFATEITDAIILDNDDIIIGGGYFKSFDTDGFLIKLTKDGTQDQNFGSNGFVDFNFFKYSYVSKLHLTQENKIIVTGSGNIGNLDNFLVARFLEDGSLDSDFGDDGYTLINFEPGISSLGFGSLLDNNQKIVIVGYTDHDFSKSAIVRLNSIGSIDSTFSDDGKIYFEIGLDYSYFRKIYQFTSNEYLVSGLSYFNKVNNLPNFDSFILKLSETGTLDNSFYDSGFMVIENPAIYDDPIGLFYNDKVLYTNIRNTGFGNMKSSSIIKFLLDDPSSKNEIENSEFEAFPNPTNNYVIIKSKNSNVSGNVVIEIYNLYGKIVYKNKFERQESIMIDFNNFPTGAYFIVKRSGKNKELTRIIKN